MSNFLKYIDYLCDRKVPMDLVYCQQRMKMMHQQPSHSPATNTGKIDLTHATRHKNYDHMPYCYR